RSRLLDAGAADRAVRDDDRADVRGSGRMGAARLRCRKRHDGRVDGTGRARSLARRQRRDRGALRGRRRLRLARHRIDRADHRDPTDRVARPMTETALLTDIVRTARGVALAVFPLAALFAVFQALFLKLPRIEISKIVTGTLLASIGLFLFLLGVAVGFMPFGRAIGEAVGAMAQKWLVALFGFVLGFVTTWGEPAVRVLADQVEEASTGAIREGLVLLAMCIGVGIAVALGMLRIAYDLPLIWILVPGYV